MVCFNVAVNGKSLCKAGLHDSGIITLTLTWVKCRPEECLPPEVEWRTGESTLHVGGLKSDSQEHIHWLDISLKIGDEVSISLIEADSVDEPSHEFTAGSTPAWKRRIGSKIQRFFSHRSEHDNGVLCFDVKCNGEKICLAGVGETGCLSAVLSWGSKRPDSFSLHVGGIIHRSDDYSDDVTWTHHSACLKDTVIIKVVESSHYDEPLERRERFEGCEFCGEKKPDAELMGGWGANICRGCLGSYVEALSQGSEGKEYQEEVQCCFCAKTSSQVQQMLSGLKGKYICDECIRNCHAALADFSE
jgi:hypothetical protein